MKAITLTQPWATLVAIGAKRIETRSWRTDYRGPLAIHAAKAFPKPAKALCLEFPFFGVLANHLVDKYDLENASLERLPLGCVVAVCDLVGIYPIEARIIQVTALDMEAVADAVAGKPPRVTSHIGNSFLLPPSEPELSFGDYSPGRFAWRLENVRALPEPVPAKGAQGLWEWHTAPDALPDARSK